MIQHPDGSRKLKIDHSAIILIGHPVNYRRYPEILIRRLVKALFAIQFNLKTFFSASQVLGGPKNASNNSQLRILLNMIFFALWFH